MSYSVRDSRPGAGEALRRELVVPARMVPGPAHPQPPSSPRDERPTRTTWRWVTAASLALVVLVSAWAFGPGGYVARSTTRDLTPVATVASVGGRADARLGAGAAWAPLQRGDVLRAGADVRTTSAGAVTLVTSDGVEVHVEANSRVDVPDARTVRFQFGAIEVDTRDARQADAASVLLAVALTDLGFDATPALFTLARQARAIEVRVLDGRVRVNGGDALDAGTCAAIPHRWWPGHEALAGCR